MISNYRDHCPYISQRKSSNFFQDARLHDTASRSNLDAISIWPTFKLRHEEAGCRGPRNQDVQALLPVVLGACCPQGKSLRKSSAANAIQPWFSKIHAQLYSCYRCHERKVKCSGGRPCQNCQQSEKAVECSYPQRNRTVKVPQR